MQLKKGSNVLKCVDRKFFYLVFKNNVFPLIINVVYMATWLNLYMHHLSENTKIQMLGIYSPMTLKYSMPSYSNSA